MSYLSDVPAFAAQADLGVQRIFGEQSTDAAAAQAIQEQKPGSEFNPPSNPDIVALTARCKVLDKLCTSLCDKLYMRAPGAAPLTWEEREDINDQLDAAERERSYIQLQLSEIYEANDNDDSEGGAFSGDNKVVGSDARTP